MKMYMILSFIFSMNLYAGGTSGGGPGIKVEVRALEVSSVGNTAGGGGGGGPRGDYGDWVVIDGEVVDLQLREGGVVDVEELEDRYRGLVKRDESGQMLIDAKVPIVDYQTQDGRIHQMTKLK